MNSASMNTASMNAVTHGLFSHDVVLTTHGEDPAEYTQFLDELTRDLRPQNLLERHCVQTIAASFWRLRRFHRWEAVHTPDPDLTPDEQFQKMERAQRAEASLHRRINTALRQLGRDLPELLQTRARLPSPNTTTDQDSHIDTQNCQNEPPIASVTNLSLREAPAQQGRAVSYPGDDTKNCQNEPLGFVPTPPLLGAGGPPDPSGAGETSRPAERGPQQSEGVGFRRTQLTLLRAQRKGAKGHHRV
jgi:hypothetical protein